MAAQFQSPHPPTGCDVVRPAGSPSRLIPIPAPPTGCDHEESRVIGTEGEFQSPHPYGMRRDQGLPRLRPRPIPIPTSLRDATASFSLPCPTSRFQSPHPYGMRLRAYRVDGRRQIPIPASLRDATPRCGPLRAATPHSNPHIPTGCDMIGSFQIQSLADSNPHIPTGCDSTPFPAGTCTPIPIPASLRDATVAVSERRRQPDDSNPHIPTGCDVRIEVYLQESAIFQSPHPYGMRPNERRQSFPGIGFQSPHPYGMRPQQLLHESTQTYNI